jgi:uncharacterized YigZ family protein
MRANYRTITGYGQSEFIIQRSRFLTFVMRVETEEEAIDFINNIKKMHHTATHNCSAYMIGEHDDIQKANDDGEPSGTAGVPILEVLKKQKLKDTAIVVTRYYGGIKLGGGGLIRAYGRAASDGISAAGTVECRLHFLMKVTVDYTWLGKVENEARQSQYILDDIKYTEDVDLYLYVPIEDEDEFSEWMNEITNGQAKISSISTKFLEFII